MRAFRLAFAATAATVALSAAPSAAAPPVGCYGLPDYPSAFLCVTSFTPANAVPTVGTGGGSTVTVPRFCAGECYGPIPVSLPGAGVEFGTGSVAVVTYNGQTYVVAVGGGLPPLPPVGVPPLPPVPPVPPVPPLPEPQTGACPGSRPAHAALAAAEPYACARITSGSTATVFVGTCATPDCTVLEVPLREIVDAVLWLVDDLRQMIQNLARIELACPVANPDLC